MILLSLVDILIFNGSTSLALIYGILSIYPLPLPLPSHG